MLDKPNYRAANRCTQAALFTVVCLTTGDRKSARRGGPPLSAVVRPRRSAGSCRVNTSSTARAPPAVNGLLSIAMVSIPI